MIEKTATHTSTSAAANGLWHRLETLLKEHLVLQSVGEIAYSTTKNQLFTRHVE